MKIAHIQHPYLPGYGYQENHLPAHQADLGHDVKIITSTEIPPKFRSEFEREFFEAGEYEYNGVKTIRLPPWFKINAIEDLALRGLCPKLNKFDPDIIHAHGLISPRTLQAYLYAERTNSKIFVDTHIDNGNLSLGSFYKIGLFSIYNYIIIPLISRKCASYIAVNRYAEQFLEDSTTVPNSRIDFLPLGISKSNFTPNNKKREKTREKLNIPLDRFVMIFAGNVEPTKDLETLLRALASISSKYELIVLGSCDQDYKNKLEVVSKELGITNKVTFIDAVPHDTLSCYLNAADLGIWPGKLGITCIEAIGTGLPLIVSNDAAMEFLVSNNNGFTFDRGSPRSLSSRIQYYIDNPATLESHSQNAASFASDELYWDTIAEKSITIYSKRTDQDH
ncbi:group 1 glycosyl transferase [Halosimplex carlsbadense 2-9-1]|uniref:Group 1 glycosyl transferase n=1 Tax=Halosimplex carlsbadense 2-9-1 TaxID=797114 RepID=M0CMR5_9EURY|nr:glycosyltransferase family 4 protein [Halosimplex carlsbadense]ELZ23697.1 group 1 glycosyl transferase [Halosimplex carlsbadense 2-9-1]